MSQQTPASASVVYPPGPGDRDTASAGRITRQFETLRSRGEKALIGFVTAGDGGLDLTRRLVMAMAAAGADVIELGIPFSDPLLDGPVIQAGSQRALDGGTRVAAIFDLVADLRSEMQTPLIFMTCVNPIRRMGMQRFARRAAEVGVDGLLITDLPPEEAGDWVETARDHHLD
ncbi:MAG: tryptophan synthase subunit alpha, partial [Chloroflexi bacterium]|nr:tryptophan synthase subunit alpha [Chloroflexota bacterium]